MTPVTTPTQRRRGRPPKPRTRIADTNDKLAGLREAAKKAETELWQCGAEYDMWVKGKKCFIGSRKEQDLAREMRLQQQKLIDALTSYVEELEKKCAN